VVVGAAVTAFGWFGTLVAAGLRERRRTAERTRVAAKLILEELLIAKNVVVAIDDPDPVPPRVWNEQRPMPTTVWNDERRVLAADKQTETWPKVARAFAWIDEANHRADSVMHNPDQTDAEFAALIDWLRRGHAILDEAEGALRSLAD
jgi:hypothetical protein